jgi:DNA-binding beta-propeller fold protein YncE
MHVLPQLRKLEQAYPGELVVVGVHSPKFPAEQSTENLRKAVQRLEIEHPVVNDRDMQVWSEYAVRAWPTLILVDPSGKVIGKHEGEMRADDFRPLLDTMIAEFDGKGMLDRRALPIQPEKPPVSPLLFPGKLLADVATGRLFISDSGHHRIIVTGFDGMVKQVIGSVRGFRDGGPQDAAFDNPQGLALDGDNLYVADTWNHAIRRIDLSTWRVETVAGTGRLAYRVIQEGPGLNSDLRSPWDLVMHQGTLYIAMAGSHQIWSYDPRSGTIARYAGTGREALTDNTLGRATFNQPSGLTTDGKQLYVADSEASAIRSLDLPGGKGEVRTLVGQGLFEFGDIDGIGDQVRLQHVLGVYFNREAGVLYLADSYNHKIKRLEPTTTKTDSFLGDGSPGLQDGVAATASFWEPGGLGMSPGRLYIADTNNHALRVVNLDTLKVTTMNIIGL